jgi:two-component system, NarL family, sensor kinase
MFSSLIINGKLSLFLAILGLFGVVFALEVTTPSNYVMGYLYISVIAFLNQHLSRAATFYFTVIAAILTLLNIWIPGEEKIDASMVANRLIVVFALIVTGILSDRNRQFQYALSQQQAKLQAQEKLASVREDFASTLAHDLKTPLLGALETLKAFQHGQFGKIQPEQKTILNMIVRSHRTSLQLVETLLDVYRNDTEGLQLHLEPVNLGTLAEEVANSLSDLAASRRVYLCVHYSDSGFRKFLWTNGDAFQLQRVFANLLTNAINHSPRGEKVEVLLETQAEYQVIKVTDAGAGIKPDEMPHLFNRFYQGQSDRQARGSGLGLYLTRQIIVAHGGTIWAENRSPRGAIFGFRLPLIPTKNEA